MLMPTLIPSGATIRMAKVISISEEEFTPYKYSNYKRVALYAPSEAM
jgi:hypothetical protein